MKYLLVSILFVFILGYVKGDKEETGSIPVGKSPSAEDDSDMYMEPLELQEEAVNVDEQQKSQNSFFPAFVQPLGHSRPFYRQEGAYSQRSEPPFQQIFDEPVRYSSFDDEYAQPSSSSSNSPSSSASPSAQQILGSGNFGVIHGGTFYNDNEGEQSSYGDFSSYFHNGHGRPSFYFGGPPNPKPQKHEQFANFKDFADINTPPERQYSEYVVVYVNKNKTEPHDETEQSIKKIHKPKNIIESLAMLDLETPTTTEISTEKKLSKSKRKLELLLPEKKHKIKLLKKEKALKDLNEPLLALS